MGPCHCAKINRSSFYSTDNVLRNQQKLCLQHVSCNMKFPLNFYFNVSKNYCKVLLYFPEAANYEAENKEANTLRGKSVKKMKEQVAVSVQIYMLSELGIPSSFNSFGKKKCESFLYRLLHLQSFLYNFLRDKGRNPTGIFITIKLETTLGG